MWPAINIIYCIFFLTKVTETDAEIKILLSTKCILCSRIISTNYTFSINDSTDYTFLQSTKCILCGRIISMNYTFSINASTDYTFLSKIYMFLR